MTTYEKLSLAIAIVTMIASIIGLLKWQEKAAMPGASDLSPKPYILGKPTVHSISATLFYAYYIL